MSESLLPWYERELVAIRRLAGEFAAANPKSAARLRLTADAVDDPHVERLLEGVAFLAARVHRRLDDELPELFEALLDLLCPHLLAPVPSMTTVQLRAKEEIQGSATVKRGSPLGTQPVRGEQLQYRTCQDVTLWPVVIEKARLSGLPLVAPINPMSAGAASVLRLSLRITKPELNFAALGLDRLRLYLRGPGQTASRLLELLCTSTMSIALADGPQDPRPTLLPAESLSHVGFTPEEAALPWPPRAFAGDRLLCEYFAYPEKFLYVELSGLGLRTKTQQGQTLEVFVYLTRPAGELERTISEDHLLLGATPAVNLFAMAAEPVALDGTQSEWRVVPDVRRPAALEVYSVDRVRFSRPDDPQPRDVRHFQHLRHSGLPGAGHAEIRMNWLAARKEASAVLGGTETFLQLRDPDFNPALPADGVLSVDTVCCNRDLPSLTPFGGGEPSMKMLDPHAPAAAVDAISPLTATLRPQLHERSGWRLLSQLSLNHLSVTGGEDGAKALREILRLHDVKSETRAGGESVLALDGLLMVEAQPGLARLPASRPGSFVRGMEIVLTFEPQAWSSGGLYLLASVLERWFALQVSVNAFVRTSAKLRGQTDFVARWPARSGTRPLV